MPIPRAAEWSWILGACLLLNLSFASFQPVNRSNGGLAYDGQHYYAMARQTPRDLPPRGAAPFVYRIGTPFLAAALAKTQDWVIAAGFDRVNLAANLLTVILLTVWLRRHVADAVGRVLVVVFFMVEPHSPMRFAYYYPIYVDPAALMFLVGGLLGLDWFAARPGFTRAVGLATLISVGVAFREVVLVIAVAMLFVPSPGWMARARSFVWLPLACGTIVLVAIHAWAIALDTPSNYTTLGEVRRWLSEKSVTQYILAWFLVFGPLLVLPFCYGKASVRLLINRPDWLAYLTVLATLAWVGGSDTERLVVFASPVVYLLIASGLGWMGIAATSPVMAVFVLAQLISSRIFVPIGGPAAPPVVGTTEWNRTASQINWVSTYDSLWSQFCGSEAIAAYLLWYGVLGAGVVAFVWSGRRQRPAASA